MENLFILIVQLDQSRARTLSLFRRGRLVFGIFFLFYFIIRSLLLQLVLCPYMHTCMRFHSYLSIQCVQNECIRYYFVCVCWLILTLVCSNRSQTLEFSFVPAVCEHPMNSKLTTISGNVHTCAQINQIKALTKHMHFYSQNKNAPYFFFRFRMNTQISADVPKAILIATFIDINLVLLHFCNVATTFAIFSSSKIRYGMEILFTGANSIREPISITDFKPKFPKYYNN